MSGTLGYDQLRAATVRQVAQLMAAAAITAPKSGGQLLLAGKPNLDGIPRHRPAMARAAHERLSAGGHRDR
jgi:hypothetical protein